MGGGVVQVDRITTVVLIGKTGNGKSSTSNSILRRKAFKSKASSSGVTTSCQLERILFEDGRLVNVIDTPGLFDFTGDTKDMAKEITKCLELAKVGVHAVLVVLSVKSRFSREEEASIKCLEQIFGKQIFDYMILVFTGGDQLEDDELTLVDYLDDSPDPLKELLCLCDRRVVLFNNKAKDEIKKAEQVNELFMYVDFVVERNEGKPYTSSLLPEAVEFDSIEGSSKLYIAAYEENLKILYEEQLQHVIEEVEKKLNAQSELLQKQLEDERIARESAEKIVMEQLAEEEEKRVKAENDAEESMIKLEKEMKEYSEKIEQLEKNKNKCVIL